MTLKALLMDTLRVKKILSREEVKKLARKNGFDESTAERRLRSEGIRTIPCIKLNSKKWPIRESERIFFYKWDGGKTYLKDLKQRRQGISV